MFSDRLNYLARIGPLQNNGGSTPTHALLSRSPAIDAGDSLNSPGVDQHGVPRSLDGNGDLLPQVDIGAVEFGFYVDSFIDATDANPGDGIVDDGAGNRTLRAAIQEADALPGDNTITLVAGTYELSIPPVSTGIDRAGDFDITDRAGRLTIIGAGADQTTIDANQLDRIFDVLPDVDFHVTGVKLTGGEVGNGRGGAAIINSGTTTVTDSVITGNLADVGGGGVYNVAGAILTITNTEISENMATGNGGGIYSTGGSVTITNTEISENTASGDGGGIYLRSCSATVRGSTISNNQAGQTGGGGGGIFNGTSATTVLIDSVLADNSAAQGGAIYNFDTTTTFSATDTTVVQNTASGSGGGVLNNMGRLIFERSSFLGNVANSSGRGGGGAHNTNGGIVKFNHTTFSGNRVRLGGAIENNDLGSLTLIHATITNNSATDRGGGVYNETTNAGKTDAKNTIIAGNTAGSSNQDIYGTEFNSFGHNLIGIKGPVVTAGFTNGVNNDIVGSPMNPVDPRLGPLQDNFGPTLTHALLPDSLAIDAGDIGGTTPAPFDPVHDQRGLQRAIDGDLDGRVMADIGAVEFGAAIDFGDAPDGFPPLLSQDGATIVSPPICSWVRRSMPNSMDNLRAALTGTTRTTRTMKMG